MPIRLRKSRIGKLLKSILGWLNRLSVDSEGRLRVLVENVDIPVALSASEDSVTVYGRDSYGNLNPLFVDSLGRVRVLSIDETVSIDGVVSVDNFPSDYPDSGTHTRLDTIDTRIYDANEQKSIIDVSKEIRDAINSVINSANFVGVRTFLYGYYQGGWYPIYIDRGTSALRTFISGDGINLGKEVATQFDYALRRCGGRLLAVIDFSINRMSGWSANEIDLGMIIIGGDVSSYQINTVDAFGIPPPEGTGSKYVLSIVVKAGGTAYVRVPIKARYYVPFSAYITVYNKDYEMEYSFYISLGGYYTAGTRQKPPKRLRLPANQWGRFVTHWFMEAHHGCAEVDIEIYNPNSVDVTVYVGIVTACEIFPHIKGHCLLVGWEGNFYVPLSNETFDWQVNVMLPTNAGDVINMWVGMGIQSDDGTTISGEILFQPGGRSLASGSTTSSTDVSRDFKVWSGRHNYYGYQTFTLEFKVSTTGAGRITYLQVVLRCFSKENSYAKWFEGSVAAGGTATLVDFWNDDKHVKGGRITVTAPSDGDVEIHAVTPEGDTVINKVRSGQTETVEIVGRYHYIYLKNLSSTTSASYRGWLEISESLLTV